jgi:predicted MFS family arabinose efflux permease
MLHRSLNDSISHDRNTQRPKSSRSSGCASTAGLGRRWTWIVRRSSALFRVSSLNTDRTGWVGHQFTLLEIVATLSICVLGLMLPTIQPLMLDALFREHLLTASDVGRVAALEWGGTAVGMGIAGVWLRRTHLRPIVATVACGLALANLVTAYAQSSTTLMMVRPLAGLCLGLLFWFFLGFLTQARNPTRWGSIHTFWEGSVALAFSVLLASKVIPLFGSRGAYLAFVVVAILILPLVPLIPKEYTGSGRSEAVVGLPTVRGLGALVAVILFSGGAMAVYTYLGPLATRTGLSSSVVATAVSMGLVGQVVGGLTAAALAYRVSYLAANIAGTICYALGAACLVNGPGASLFIAVAGLFRLVQVGVLNFALMFVAEADPTRRSLMFISLAGFLGAALGPASASPLVRVFGVLVVLAVMAFGTCGSLAIMVLFRLVWRNERVTNHGPKP